MISTNTLYGCCMTQHRKCYSVRVVHPKGVHREATNIRSTTFHWSGTTDTGTTEDLLVKDRTSGQDRTSGPEICSLDCARTSGRHRTSGGPDIR